MVKIRLRRIGTKGRPFYRIVVAKSTAGRNGAFVETIGTYDPLTKPSTVTVDQERALHWLLTGAQPTETTAYLLNKSGVLPRFFEQRPKAKKDYGFLDKRTAAISKKSAIEAPAEAPKAEEPKAEKLADDLEKTIAEVEGAEPSEPALPEPETVEAGDAEPVSAEAEAAPETSEKSE